MSFYLMIRKILLSNASIFEIYHVSPYEIRILLRSSNCGRKRICKINNSIEIIGN